ncbi:MAG TPA: hypothetical protein VFV28_06265 [Limnobacter sp.]|nr:hypothetical protein [Limnobacter sp.]
MPFRVADELRTPEVFNTGMHVLVDASGAGQGSYCMAAVIVESGIVLKLLSSPCKAKSSVLAEQECIEWAFSLWPAALVWNDCIPAIEAVLALNGSAKGRLFWPTPRMRKPFHDLVHQLSVSARGLNVESEWSLLEGQRLSRRAEGAQSDQSGQSL